METTRPSENPALLSLMRIAAANATATMARFQSFPPSLYFIGDEGVHTIQLASGKTEFPPQMLREFGQVGRLLGLAVRSVATVLASEVWMPSPGFLETNPGKAPVDDPDRGEFITLVGQADGAFVISQISIVRRSDGEFVGLGEPSKPVETQVKSHVFGGPLPPGPVPESIALMAREELDKIGIGPVDHFLMAIDPPDKRF